MKRSEFLKLTLFAAASPKLINGMRTDLVLTGTSGKLPAGVKKYDPLIFERPLTWEEAFRPNNSPLDNYLKPKYQGINLERFTDLSE